MAETTDAFNVTIYNIHRHAADISSAAAEAVKVIRARRAALDAQGKAARPLVVLAGENHHDVAHHIFHMLAIESLHKSERIAVGLEGTYDLLVDTYAVLAGRPATPSIKKTLKRMDKDGAHTLKAWVSTWRTNNADHSRRTLCNFLLNHNVPTRFTDASDENLIARCDYSPEAASLLERTGGNSKNIGRLTPVGVALRNDHIVNQLMYLARDTGARIIYMQCGAAHISGFVGEDKPKDGLAAKLKDRNVAILAMTLLSRLFTEADIPPDNGLTLDEQHIVRSMPSLRSTYDSRTGERVNKGFSSADLKTRAMEAAYLRQALERLGYESDVLTVEDMQRGFELYPEGDGKAIGALKPTLLERLGEAVANAFARFFGK